MAAVSKREWKGPGGEAKSAWVVRYLHGGKHRSKQFERKKDADLFRQKVERERSDGVHVTDSQSMTVKAACDLFLKHQEDRMRDGRIGRNRHDTLRTHINVSVVPLLGSLLMSAVTGLRIEAWYVEMTRAGELHPTTARDRVQTFKLIEAFAAKRGACRGGQSAIALKELGGFKRTKIRTFTAVEVNHLLAVASHRAAHKARSSALLKVAVNIAAHCGLRLGEVMGLTLDNVDLHNRVIHVVHSLPYWDDLKDPKTPAGIRDVYMPLHVAVMLQDWIKAYMFRGCNRRLIFRTPTGGRIDNGNFNGMWTGLLKRAGLIDDGPKFHFHALRHFHASWLIANQVALPDVALMLGHEKFDVTLQVYAHSVAPGVGHKALIDRVSQRLANYAPALDYALIAHD